jgi:serine/threonine-protein kinase
MPRLPSSPDATPGLDGDPSASRYELLCKIASGGMATVYVGRLRGAAGFSRTVAIKRAHAHLIENPTYKQMLVDEARLASRLHHPNVVAVLDVEELAGELRLVMDYVEGTALSDLIAKTQAREQHLPPRVALRVALDACHGLAAAHDLCDENGKSLGLVHRDISPHNILVGVDGSARLADFGIAKHAEGAVSTTTGALKGKIGYMAPEYVEHGKLDARSDVFSLGVVIWEALANQKLFRGMNELDTLKRIVAGKVPPLSSVAPWVGDHLDSVLAAALALSPDERFSSAHALGTALETAARKGDLLATPAEVGAYVRDLVGATLEERRRIVRERMAPVRTAPTVTRAPGEAADDAHAPEEVAAMDRPTVPDKGGAAVAIPEEPAARGESSITLGQPTSFDTEALVASRGRWKAPAAIGAAAAALGVVLVLATRGTAPSPGAPGGVEAASVLHPSTAAPAITVSASATAASADAPVASAPSSSASAAPPRASAAVPAAKRAPAKAAPSAAPAAPEGPVHIDKNPY